MHQNARLQSETQQRLADSVLQNDLPQRYLDEAESYLLPIAEQLSNIRKNKQAIIVGIQGTQGSGKSTTAVFLKLLLQCEFDLSVAICSIDDFYLSQLERQELAINVHPLLRTRGVPGTHHVDRIHYIFQQFRDGQAFTLPQFDKARDNPKPISQQNTIDCGVDVLIFEGWCVGVPAQPAQQLVTALNSLERDEDTNGVWRRFVNQQLKDDYSQLFAQLDLLLVLQSPSFDCVYEWRHLQEQKLVERLQKEGKSTRMTLSDEQLKTFIQHYQRLSEHALTVLAERANFVLYLDESHRTIKLHTDLRGL